MMLTDAEDVEAHLVGERDLLDQFREAARGVYGGARRVDRGVGERIDAEFHTGRCQESRAARNRSEFPTTLTELKAIAALASTGLSRSPNAG